MKKHNLIPLLIFSIVSLVYVSPIFDNFLNWGQMDWDQFTFWNAVPRETILKYHQFPLWNPYVNGGNVLLAHPDSPFLSPFYVFVLIFGPIIGLKLEIIVHLIIGLWGMFLLARHMKLSRSSSYFTSFVYMLSSVYALHLTEGQTEWLALAFVPWVFLCYLESLSENRKILRAIAFLGLILISGVYVFSVLAVFLLVYALLKAVQLRQIVPIKILAIIFSGAFLLCSIKLFPMLEFLHKYPRANPDFCIWGTRLAELPKILLSRNQAIFDIKQWIQMCENGFVINGWHEYGAYIGIIPLSLSFLGAIVGFKKNWPLIFAGLVSLIIVFGSEFPVDLWAPLHKMPVYESLTVPSRFIFSFIFVIAILSGLGLSFVEKYISTVGNKRYAHLVKPLSFLIVSIIVFDLCLVNSPIFKSAFRVPPIKVKSGNLFSQRYRVMNFHKEGLAYSSLYPILLSNSGILNGYEIVNIKRGDVRIVSDPDYKGEVYLAESEGHVEIEYFSPNKIIVNVSAEELDILVVNQNYYIGWKVKNGEKTMQAESFNGLISTPAYPGERQITFYYLPGSFLLGLLVTLSFIVFVVVFYVWKRCMFHGKH